MIVTPAEISAGSPFAIACTTVGIISPIFAAICGAAAAIPFASDWANCATLPIICGRLPTKSMTWVSMFASMSVTGTPAAFRPMNASAATISSFVNTPMKPPIIRNRLPSPSVDTPSMPRTGPSADITVPHTFIAVPTVPTTAAIPMIALITAGCSARKLDTTTATLLTVTAMSRNRAISSFRIGPMFAATFPKFPKIWFRRSLIPPASIPLIPTATPLKKPSRPPATAGDSMISFSFDSSDPNAVPAAGPICPADRPSASSSSSSGGS